MDTVANTKDNSFLDSLAQARSLNLPSRQEMLVRATSVSKFWSENRHLLADAWRCWDKENEGFLPKLGESLLDTQLRQSVNAAWDQPDLEHEVAKLWTEVSPGVFECQFFDPDRLAVFREYLSKTQDSEIPTRPPYGIALNRFGAMLDQRSEGYLAAGEFQQFYKLIMHRYMRPIARLLFPEVVGYDTQTFGFSIKYEPGVDTSLQLHSDASAATMNINLNLPGEEFSGSEVDFYDPTTGKVERLSFKPGVAMLHRGAVPHAAQPIKSGQRTNMVLWLYGDRMQVPAPNLSPSQVLTAEQRWVFPKVNEDSFAPF